MATSNDFIQRLQKIYAEDWYVRVNPCDIPTATRLDRITDDEMSNGVVMTLFEGKDDQPLADQLVKQTLLKYCP